MNVENNTHGLEACQHYIAGLGPRARAKASLVACPPVKQYFGGAGRPL